VITLSSATALERGLTGRDCRHGLVEGFFDCTKVHQAGFPVVALMGLSLSVAQEDPLATKFERSLVMLDGDEPGRRGSAECLTRLASRMWVRDALLPEGEQPDQLSLEVLLQLLKCFKRCSPPTMYSSLFCIVYDPHVSIGSYVSAGHQPAAIVLSSHNKPTAVECLFGRISVGSI
jgi:Toprim domain-containing protein